MMVANKSAGRTGLGCVTFGREIDKATSFTMMDYAVVHGISFFDTAAAYAGGVSEEIVGAWLAENPQLKEQVVVATKILPPYDAGSIIAAVDESRRRLGVETIDLLFLHRWDEQVLTIETLMALHHLVLAGTIQALGASNFSAAQLDQAVHLQKKLQLHPFRFAQNNHNYAVREYNLALQQVCKTHGIDMLTYSPLGAGFLTGKHSMQVQPGSRFDVMPAHQSIYFNAEAQTRLQRLMTVAEKNGYSPAQLALAWAFKQPASMVLAGGRTIAHLNQALEAMAFNNDEVLSELGD